MVVDVDTVLEDGISKLDDLYVKIQDLVYVIILSNDQKEIPMDEAIFKQIDAKQVLDELHALVYGKVDVEDQTKDEKVNEGIDDNKDLELVND